MASELAPPDYAGTAAPGGYNPAAMQPAQLTAFEVDRSWLYRALEVCAPWGEFFVEYDGRGLGYESVYVNGRLANRRRSPLWFVPHFEFDLGGHRACLDLRFWPWCTLRSISLSVGQHLVYAGG